MVAFVDGYLVAPGAFDAAEVQTLRAGVENAAARAVTLAEVAARWGSPSMGRNTGFPGPGCRPFRGTQTPRSTGNPTKAG
ncbi:MAG: hypothetical protein ACRDTG_05180 [Pseudonocardiaceae bacterium]